ncbi:MAG: phospholipase D-like domain-containing protein [Thermodesulfobacteriota bacterium]
MAGLIAAIPRRFRAAALAAAALVAVLVLPCQATTTVFKHIDRTFLKGNEVRVLADGDYYPALEQAIDGAQRQIRMVMFLFRPTGSGNNRPAKIIAALGRARKRGVDVRVILEAAKDDSSLNSSNRAAARKLREQGIAVFYDTPTTTTHAKMVVIDGRTSVVGSHNLTQSALSRNHELSLIIDNRDLAARLLDYIERLPAHPAN